MISLRTKLTLGFGSLLLIVAGIGIMIQAQLSQLGEAIDVILKENYRSVVACQNMKEALERIDSGFLITMAGNKEYGDSLIEANLQVFAQAFSVEKNNVTLPGEQQSVDELFISAENYFSALLVARDQQLSAKQREIHYFTTINPLFANTKELAQEILVLNQSNMSKSNDLAREQAASVKTRVKISILICGIIAIFFSFLTQTWVLRPIRRLIDSVREVGKGNLDLVLHSESSDEIGQLATAFNSMTQALRERRRSDDKTLQRTQQATKEVISTLSTAIAITDTEGRIEISTETAQDLFGLKTGTNILDSEYTWLHELFKLAISEAVIAEFPLNKGYLQIFDNFRELFFQPVVIPIPVTNDVDDLTGTVILFRDKTQEHEQQELKSSVVSTVSHQLKTPITSLKMSLHLLLNENIGVLNEKQSELLIAARDDIERLSGIIGDLLDINRLSNDQQLLQLKYCEPQYLINDAVFPFLSEARDKGIELVTDTSGDLPGVMVDYSIFPHVFINMINNALQYTLPGGKITISAKKIDGKVKFMIKDTGIGIAPEHQKRIYDQFYRVPENPKKGAGLGLTIVKEIVRAHGGEVGLESELNIGSTFWFELPSVTDKVSLIPVNIKEV